MSDSMESCICFILYIFRTTQFLWILTPNSHTYSYSQNYGHLVDNTYLFLQFRTANHTSHSIKYFFKNVILIKIALGWIAKLFPCHWNLQYVFPFLKFGLVMWLILTNGPLTNIPTEEFWKAHTHWSLLL